MWRSRHVSAMTSVEQARLGGQYWRVWTSSVVSNVGDGVSAVALPLLAASLSADPRIVAGVAAAGKLPWLFFALLSGAIVDRLDRRKLMVGVNAFRGLLVVVFAILVSVDEVGIGVIYAFVFIIGICETLFDNAATSILPSVVRSSELERANSRLYAAEVTTNSFLGPPIGGLLFAAAVAAPFFVDAVSFFIAAGLIWTLSGSYRPAPPEHPSDHPGSITADIAAGVRWLWKHRLLRTLSLLLGAYNFVEAAVIAVLVLLATQTLGMSDRAFGFIFIGGAIGAVAGAIGSARIVTTIGTSRALLGSLLTGALTYVLIGLSTAPWMLAVCLGLSWFVGTIWNIVTITLRQRLVPDHLLGRVNSAYRFVGLGALPLGALAGGFTSASFGLRTPAIIGGCLLAIAAVLTAKQLLSDTANHAQAHPHVDASGRDP